MNMRKYSSIGLAILLTLSSSCSSANDDLVIEEVPEVAETYTNPVWNGDFPDPTIWKGDDGYYYAVATSLNKLISSKDLVHWNDTGLKPISEETRLILQKKGKNLWAPDVVKINDQRLMYIALYNSVSDCRIAVLRESDTKGVFEYVQDITYSKENGIIDTIDPEVVRSEDGRLWMFFGSTGGIHRVQLNDDGLSVMPGANYEHIAGLNISKDSSRRYVFEGTYLYYHNGYWYLFASDGHYNSYDYGIVVGRSKTIDGDFIDKSGNNMTEGGGSVILSSLSSDYFYGGGHNGEIFEDMNNHYFIFYHCHNKDTKGTSSYIPRPLMLQQLYWDEDGWPYLYSYKPANEDIVPVF